MAETFEEMNPKINGGYLNLRKSSSGNFRRWSKKVENFIFRKKIWSWKKFNKNAQQIFRTISGETRIFRIYEEM